MDEGERARSSAAGFRSGLRGSVPTLIGSAFRATFRCRLQQNSYARRLRNGFALQVGDLGAGKRISAATFRPGSSLHLPETSKANGRNVTFRG